MTFPATLPLLGLNGITLRYGGHKTRDDGVCALEAVAWLAGEPHSDKPQCACPVVAAFVRAWNDRLATDAERDQWLKPILPRLIGSRTTREVELTRAFLCADWAVRTVLLSVLQKRNSPHATVIAALEPITDRDTALAARLLLLHAASAADAAAAAAAYAASVAAAAADAAAAASAAASAAAAAADAAADAANELRSAFVLRLLDVV